MIHPTTAHVLRCVAFTMDDLVKPDPAGRAAASALATASHLMRYAGLRLEKEGAMLVDDILDLRGLLAKLRAYFDALGAGEPGAASTRSALAEALSPGLVSDPAGRDAQTLAAEARMLRECLYRTQRLLQGDMRERRKDESDYQQVRGLVREYIAADLVREAALVEPAFRGQGPRR